MMRLLFVALALGAAPVLAQDKIGKPSGSWSASPPAARWTSSRA